MSDTIKTIGVLTSGGDSPGMNAAVRAVVRRGLSKGMKVIGVPCTIDGDIACTDYTIGFDTAVNTAMRAIDNIRDTASSHEKCSMIEVMGRNAGYIALWCGIANGAESVVIPETYDYNEVKIMKTIAKHRENGKKNNIIINAEGIGDTTKMAKRIQAISGIHIRATILSYIQRGGTPTCRDRVYASVMGAKAVDLLDAGIFNRVVAHRKGDFVDIDIDEALSMEGGMTPGLQYMNEILEDLSV